MNNFLHGLTEYSNIKLTENGSKAYKSTNSALYDMFAFGGAYRKRSDEDCILLFKNAYEENPEYALKCLFYLRDCRGGAGERRFWRVCARWLAYIHPEAAIRNVKYTPIVGRWDDLYTFLDTPAEDAALKLIRSQLELDVQCTTPSLCAKWIASENASSQQTRAIANRIRKYLKLTHREYRKLLSALRTRINVLEKLMSENRWDEIVFDKIPSKAGLIYRNAFARHDITKAYEKFAHSDKAVNAGTLYPYECVREALKITHWDGSLPDLMDTQRLMVNKYWGSQTNFFNDATLNGLCVVDTSGSMSGQPIEVAISLGLYCAERAKGPFANHYISFASRPRLIKTEGIDFCDKVARIWKNNLIDNTNLEAVFDLLLDTAIRNNCKQSDLPETIIIISDMEIDEARGGYWSRREVTPVNTVMETARNKFAAAGYKMPNLVYWNVDARHETILDAGPNVSYVSGCSPTLFRQILTGKTGQDLMFEALNSERYKDIA